MGSKKTTGYYLNFEVLVLLPFRDILKLMHSLDFAFFLLPALFFITIVLISIYLKDRSPVRIHKNTVSPLEKFVTFSFGKLWVYDSDSENLENKPTVLFIHSIGASVYSWRFQIPEFQKKYRVIAFDLLGFGKSDKPIDQNYGLKAQEERILELLEHLNIKNCNLIGCSLGGALALWLASQHKNKFDSVVAIAPAAVPSVVPLLPLPHHKLSPLANALSSRTLIRIALYNGYSQKSNITTDVVDNYFAPFREKNGMSCFLRTVESIKDPRIFKSLSTITQPLLLLWGKKDRVIVRKVFELIARETPHAEIAHHPTGGHHLMEDEPEWTNQKVFAFLDKSLL